jgi:putative membrane protein
MRLVPAAATGVWALLASPALAQGISDRDGWWMNWGWGHMAFGGVMMVVFWGGVILLVVLLARGLGWLGQRDGVSSGRQSPLEILQERFARGEIDQKEYDQRSRTLSGRG